jgi:spermidine synthase
VSGLIDVLRFLLLGALSLTIQTALVRESLFAFHGGEIGLGLFFTIWLASIAAGARVGSSLVCRPARPANARDPGSARAPASAGESASRTWGAWFDLGLLLLPWLGLFQIGILRHHRALLPVDAGGYLPVQAYLALLLLAVAPAGAWTGFLFPAGLKAGRISPGKAYGVEAFGSMAGGAFASLVALPRIPVLALLGALMLLAAAAGILSSVATEASRRASRLDLPGRNHAGPHAGGGARVWMMGASAIVALALLAGGVFAGIDRAWMARRWALLETGTECQRSLETPYHQVTIATRAGEASLFVDGLYAGALADPYADSLAAAVVMTQHASPREILLVAPALIGPARVIASARDARVTLVREDARLGDLVAQLLPRGTRADSGEGNLGVRHVTADARALARAWSHQSGAPEFDLIAILQGGPATGAANRLYTQECFEACARILRSNGVLMVAIPGAENVASPEIALTRASVVTALRAVFREVRVTPGSTHDLFAAGPWRSPVATSPLTWDPDSLAARRARLWPGEHPWPARLFAALLPRERIDDLARTIAAETENRVEPNRDRRPIAYFEQIRRWDRLSGSHLSGFLNAWRQHPGRWSMVFLAVLALLGLMLRRRYGQSAVSLASTGLVGMSADLALLLLYQTTRGTLYLRVGLVVALYMCGLGLGALLGERIARRARVRGGALAGADLAWVAFLGVWLLLLARLPDLGGSATDALLFALTLVAGGLTALPFPWVAARLGEHAIRRAGDGARPATVTRERPVAGGLANAIDHAGALLGALVTGTFLIPVLGFEVTLLVLAAVKALSAIGWVKP